MKKCEQCLITVSWKSKENFEINNNKDSFLCDHKPDHKAQKFLAINWIIMFFFVHTQTPDVTKKRIQKYTTCERREEECQKTSLVSSSVGVKGEEYKSRVH